MRNPISVIKNRRHNKRDIKYLDNLNTIPEQFDKKTAERVNDIFLRDAPQYEGLDSDIEISKWDTHNSKKMLRSFRDAVNIATTGAEVVLKVPGSSKSTYETIEMSRGDVNTPEGIFTKYSEFTDAATSSPDLQNPKYWKGVPLAVAGTSIALMINSAINYLSADLEHTWEGFKPAAYFFGALALGTYVMSLKLGEDIAEDNEKCYAKCE